MTTPSVISVPPIDLRELFLDPRVTFIKDTPTGRHFAYPDLYAVHGDQKCLLVTARQEFQPVERLSPRLVHYNRRPPHGGMWWMEVVPPPLCWQPVVSSDRQISSMMLRRRVLILYTNVRLKVGEPGEVSRAIADQDPVLGELLKLTDLFAEVYAEQDEQDEQDKYIKDRRVKS